MGYMAMPNERITVNSLQDAVDHAVYKVKNTTKGMDVYTFTLELLSIKGAVYAYSHDGRKI